jgi:hypothetical protein
VVYKSDESFEIVDLLLVASMEVTDGRAASSQHPDA